jgi:hypothetical protein
MYLLPGRRSRCYLRMILLEQQLLEKFPGYQALAAVSGKDMLCVSWLLLPEGNTDLPKLIMANDSDKQLLRGTTRTLLRIRDGNNIGSGLFHDQSFKVITFDQPPPYNSHKLSE